MGECVLTEEVMMRGWILSNNENGIAEIQRVDELQIFDCDASARKFVQEMADKGDKRCLDALSVVGCVF